MEVWIECGVMPLMAGCKFLNILAAHVVLDPLLARSRKRTTPPVPPGPCAPQRGCNLRALLPPPVALAERGWSRMSRSAFRRKTRA
eukprot:scaffold305676_cov37-Tisochrysis_lutea.AAC.4